MAMPRVLFVDDAASILQLYATFLRANFDVETAECAEDARAILGLARPFDVVVADCFLPGEDGISLLKAVGEQFPDTSRILITGNGDVELASRALSEGRIMRFLTKPCDRRTLLEAVEDGVRIARRVRSQSESLEQLLGGTVMVLLEICAERAPGFAGRTKKITELCHKVTDHLGEPRSSELDLAVHLSRLECLRLNDRVIEKIETNKPLTDLDRDAIRRGNVGAVRIIDSLPRMKKVAEIIRYRNRRFDDVVLSPDLSSWEDIPLGARVMLAVESYIDHRCHMAAGAAIAHMARAGRAYDPQVLEALTEIVCPDHKQSSIRLIAPTVLKAGDILQEDVTTKAGKLLLSRGATLSDSHAGHLIRLGKQREIASHVAIARVS